MIFQAEITKVEVKKTLSQDKEFKVILITDDPKVIELEQFINDSSVEVSIDSPNHDYKKKK